MISLQKSFIRLNFLNHYNKIQFIDQPKLRRRTIVPIYPPPGMSLQLPGWTPEQFLLKIGGGCSEYADKFETLQEVFETDRFQMREKGVPPQIRKYIFSIKEQLRRGVLTFEYLSRRTALTKRKKK